MRIPVMILSGFLGSGKTSLLLRLLQETKSRGLKPGILMNELGKQDVDGAILSEHADISIEKLLDGCICCSKKSELAGSLQSLLREQPDVLFIELTGVANPEEIVVVLSDPAFENLVQEAQVITVIDAEHVLEYNSIFSSDRQLVRTLRRQIEVANLLIVNKTDLVAPKKLEKINNVIRKQNERAEIIYTTHSQIDATALLYAITPQENRRTETRRFHVLHKETLSEDKHAGHNHPQESDSYSQIQTITLSFPADHWISKERLVQFLHSWKEQLVRAKGYIRIDRSKAIELMQYAGNQISWETSTFPGKPYLVFIGLSLNEKLLEAEWNKLFQTE